MALTPEPIALALIPEMATELYLVSDY